MLNKSKLFLALITLGASKILLAAEGPVTTLNTIVGEFKHEVRQFQKPYDNQQAEQISLMV